jgi:hypothetical protein
MNKILTLCVSLLFFGCNSTDTKAPTVVSSENENLKEQSNSYVPTQHQFQAVWDEVLSDRLQTLPQDTISYSKLFDGAVDLISRNAERTLSDENDILEPFDKLAHPNGVCLSGIWKIDTSNPYSGYFKNGSESLVIARASTAMSETKRGETRAFGMAVKLFGTLEREEILEHSSANIFVIDDLGGTDAEYYTDVSLTNEPDVSFTSSVFSAFAYGLKVASAFSDADEHSGIRQLYEISYLGENNNSSIITPKWIKIEAEQNQTAFGVNDFREEFILGSEKKLVFTISVASEEREGVKQFQKIGTITFDTSVVSTTCDHRLHFHHPLWRDDLNYE